MLPLLTPEDSPQVIKRVMDAWERSEYHDRVRIDSISSPVSFGDGEAGQVTDE